MSVQKLTERDLERGERVLEAIYDEVDNRLNPDREECWYCGGEGETYECFDDLCGDAEWGCPDCARPCSVCRINAAARAKAVRIEVIKSDDIAVAIAWMKEHGRWNDSITVDQVRDEIAKARAKLEEDDAGRAALKEEER